MGLNLKTWKEKWGRLFRVMRAGLSRYDKAIEDGYSGRQAYGYSVDAIRDALRLDREEAK